MAIDLVFSAAPATNGSLVFGDDGTAPPITDATVAFVASLPALGGAIGVALGRQVDLSAALPELSGVIPVGTGMVQYISLQTTLPGLSGSADVLYDSRTSRPTVGQVHAPSQLAVPIGKGLQSAAQSAQARPAGTSASHQLASQLIRGIPLHHDNAIVLRKPVSARHSTASRLPTAQTSLQHQDAIRTARASRQALHSSAERLPTPQITLSHQDAYRDRRLHIAAVHQDATAFYIGLSTSAGKGLPLDRGWVSRFEAAMRPPSGLYVRPLPPDSLEPCYVPSAALLFDADWSADGKLVFICERHAVTPPIPGATIVVLVKRVYMTINSISLRRIDGDIPIPAYAFSMSLDADSWTWSWSASVPASALPLVQPGSNGDPVEVEALVNGVPYRLCCEGIGSQREFAKTRISVQGRGTAAILDSPYAPVLNHGNAAPRTAQQLMADVLTVNGVGIGWAVDWGLTDWLVPGNVWAHQGAYISAILDIAQAAGGYVQPHNTAQTLRILPRYPAAPWNWVADVTPDYELPAAACAVEGIDWLRKPAYSRVHVSGAAQGVLGQVTRAGTAGDVLAPMVTDALITHADAARQRGLAILSDGGQQARVSLKLPVLAETGLILPGKFVRYVDGAQTRLGLVRGTSLDWSAPKLRQTISLETHLD